MDESFIHSFISFVRSFCSFIRVGPFHNRRNGRQAIIMERKLTVRGENRGIDVLFKSLFCIKRTKLILEKFIGGEVVVGLMVAAVAAVMMVSCRFVVAI